MCRGECGEATCTAGNRGTWLRNSLSELEPVQVPQDHVGIASTFTGLFKFVHLFQAGRDEDLCATTVREMAAGTLPSLRLCDWKSRAIEPQTLCGKWNHRCREVELVQDHQLGLLQTVQWKARVGRHPEDMLGADCSNQTFDEE